MCVLGFAQEIEDYLATFSSRTGSSYYRFSVGLNVCLGRIDEAFAAIEGLIGLGDNIFFRFPSLMEDPRWQLVEDYMNLPEGA